MQPVAHAAGGSLATFAPLLLVVGLGAMVLMNDHARAGMVKLFREAFEPVRAYLYGPRSTSPSQQGSSSSTPTTAPTASGAPDDGFDYTIYQIPLDGPDDPA